MNNKPRIIMISACVIAVMSTGLVGCGKNNEFVAPPPPGVTVAHPEQKDITVYEQFPGRISAKETIEVRARVQGYLRSIDFVDGGMVEKGQLLFTIEPEPYEAEVDVAKANLESAKAKVQLADATYMRMKKAYESKSIAELDVLQAEAELNIAKANVLKVEAGLEKAEIDLSYTKIKSSLSGRASRNLISIGNLVGGGDATLLTTVVTVSPVYAYFDINERKLLKIMSHEKVQGDAGKLGSKGKVLLDLADGNRYESEGVIDYTSNVLNPDTGTLKVRAEFPNAGKVLKAGMYCRVLYPSLVKDAVIVPDHAIQRDLAGTYVLTVDSAGKVARSSVDIGKRVEGDKRIVVGKVGAKDLIVVQGMQRAQPGSMVTPDTEAQSSTVKPKEENGE